MLSPLKECKLHKDLCSQPDPKSLERCVVLTRHSINKCRDDSYIGRQMIDDR